MTEFVQEATVDLADGADPRAVGGAITVALCGHWDHEPPCHWPHHTDIAVPAKTTWCGRFPWIWPRARGRGKIVAALKSGEQAGPDGRVSRWTVND